MWKFGILPNLDLDTHHMHCTVHFLSIIITISLFLASEHTSVATVMTDVFQKNEIMVSRKLAKIMRIFVDIGRIKHRGVIYWPERFGPVIPTLWSGHDFGQNSWPKPWPLHSVGITSPNLSSQYMTPRFLMRPISTNILTILANFLDTIIPFFWKTSVMTVATLEHTKLLLTSQQIPLFTMKARHLHVAQCLPMQLHITLLQLAQCLTPCSHRPQTMIQTWMTFRRKPGKRLGQRDGKQGISDCIIKGM